MEGGSATTDRVVRQKTRVAIRRKRAGDSNEIDESDSQPSKHDEQRLSTEHGIRIDVIDEAENADGPIRFNDDPD
jgi:hypothetical protein